MRRNAEIRIRAVRNVHFVQLFRLGKIVLARVLPRLIAKGRTTLYIFLIHNSTLFLTKALLSPKFFVPSPSQNQKLFEFYFEII